MRSPTRLALALALTLAGLTALSRAGLDARAGAPAPGAWARDSAWYDGRAERCTYDATRTIYGRRREYAARAYTNKQKNDPETTVKATGDGLEVFKHHWSERVPTENYDYDFSTAAFVRTADLSPFRLVAATQEDCGASFKRVVADTGGLSWLESVYFPGGGLRNGRVKGSDVQFEDALPLVLRDYPFESPHPLELRLIQSQKDTHRVPFEPLPARVTLVGRETRELPIGRVDTYHLTLELDGQHRADYWFLADGSAPALHALAEYSGPNGITYALRSQERTAYWEH